MISFHGRKTLKKIRPRASGIGCAVVLMMVLSGTAAPGGEWKKRRAQEVVAGQRGETTGFRTDQAVGSSSAEAGSESQRSAPIGLLPPVIRQGSDRSPSATRDSIPHSVLTINRSPQPSTRPAVTAGQHPSIPAAGRIVRTGLQTGAHEPVQTGRDELPAADNTAVLVPLLPSKSVSEQAPPDAGKDQQTLPIEQNQNGNISLEPGQNGTMSISVTDAPIRDVLSVLARAQGLNILTTDDVDARISGTFRDITFQEAMDSVFALTDATWTVQGNVILVTKLSADSVVGPEAQGRVVRVFDLNFIAAVDVEKVVSTLVSPAGRVAINEVSSQDSNKTREQIIVEDLPKYLKRIEEYVRAIDIAPRQVVIEAHILQVDLKNDSAHGVDFARLGEVAGVPISVSTPSFNGTVSDLSTFAPPSYSIALLDGSKSSALIDMLKKTTDAKTLASPKVMALNGQEASVQIGEKLGYFVTTSTDTASLQSVEFLETGVVLKVTPRITDDGRIMMKVMPEVSDGSVSDLGLPSERTTEVSTTLMLSNGMGMVVGGLITETDVDTQQRVPVLGSVWGVGRLFRRKQVVRERSEIIIALVPHIVDCHCPLDVDSQLQRATTPLLHGPLQRMPRPWEPELPDPVTEPRRINMGRMADEVFSTDKPRPADYFFPTDEESRSAVSTGYTTTPRISAPSTLPSEAPPVLLPSP
ncbi:MAG: hypothetical protein RIK87_00290 [Fuerstiella sp.]